MTMKPCLINQHDEAFNLLRGNLACWQVPPELVDELIERQIAITYERGAMVFCEGNADGLIACVLSGYVKVYCPIGEGSRTLVRLAGPGNLIGYTDYIDEKGRRARLFEAQAASKCTVALFSRDHISRLLSAMPPAALIHIIQSLNTFWSQNLQLFVTLLTLSFSDRLQIVLSDLAARAGVKDSQGTLLIPTLGHEDLAEMIGCSRPMVSRLMAEMTDSGLIARRGKQYVLLNKWDSRCLHSLDRSAAKPVLPQPNRASPFHPGSMSIGLPKRSAARFAEVSSTNQSAL
jgi:CRP/FNR family transcriptional regulator, cyclic AMP receptor protein